MDEESIKRAAYEIWEKQGKPQGLDFQHWLQAKNEIDEASGGGLPNTLAIGTTPPASPQARVRRASSSKAKDAVQAS